MDAATAAKITAFLTPAQLADFKRDGYLVVRGMFDAAAMGDIARWTEEIVSWPEVPGRHMVYYEDSLTEAGRRVLQRIENFAPFHAGFDRTFNDGPLHQCVSDLFAEPALLFKDKINFKLPGGSGFTPHQDAQAGWDDYAGYYITALVSIDDATEENGCLELAAGCHDRGLIGELWKPLSESDMAGMDFQTCPTRPGDVVLFDSYAPHRSGPNLTGSPRRVLYVTYNRSTEGDHRARYYADKRKSFPPDCERDPDTSYVFKV